MQYLEHLSEADRALLSRTTGSSALDDRVLGDPRVFRAVFDPESMLVVSPFLVFAAAIHQVARDLQHVSYIEEWVGPHRRVPVFDTSGLKDLLAGPERRMFLAELLASFSHVASGVVWVRSRGRWRRRRWSELDPLQLAELLETVPPAQRAGVYRRLGDVALFLVGVFPDYTAERALSSLERERLARTLERSEEPSGADAPPAALELFEGLGSRWYRAACTLARAFPTTALRVVEDIADRFRDARRVLNVLTDRYLFPYRSLWFGNR